MVIYLTQNIGRAMLVSLPTSEDIELVAEILDTFSDGLKSMISASKEDYEENNTTGSEWITDESSNKPNLFDNIIKDIHSIFENFATLFNPNLENQKNKEETNKPKQDSNKAEQDTSKPEENINNPTNFNTENQAQATESQTEAVDNEIPMARRKRNIDTNFKMPELPEASAGLSLITNPLSPSDSISTDSKVSLPDQSLLNIFPTNMTGNEDVLNQTLSALDKQIKQFAEQGDTAQGIEIQNAIQQGKELIYQEMEKTKLMQQFVNTTLNKISKVIETLVSILGTNFLINLMRNLNYNPIYSGPKN